MKFLDQLEEWLITLLIGAATVITFVAVMHRYASGFAIPGLQDWLISINLAWAQELTIIMFVWMAKFGAAYGVRTGIHVGVDVLINRLADKTRAKFIVFGLLPARSSPASSPPWAATSCGRTAPITRSSTRSDWIPARRSKARSRSISSGRPGWCTRPSRSAAP
jgi:hypothetical protein